MAHFAQIDDNNIVVQVIVADQEFIDGGTLGDPTRWIQTSYNTRGGIYYYSNSDIPSDDQTKALRKNFAGVGYFYDKEKDAFIPPRKDFIPNSWILGEFSCIWEPPIPRPEDGKFYVWVEEQLAWVIPDPTA